MPLGNHHIITALVNHAQQEIERIGLGSGQVECSPMTVSEISDGVALSDGLSFYVECRNELEINRQLREYRESLDLMG